MRKFLTIASAAVALVTASPALSAGHTWQVGPDAFSIHLDDLNLTVASGRAEALARVEAAAARVCRKAGPYAARKECRDDVVARMARTSGSSFVRVALAEREQANVRLAQSK